MTTPNIYRSRILNEISESDVGKTIRVAGWVENIRDHGGVSFIDLRDKSLFLFLRPPTPMWGLDLIDFHRPFRPYPPTD